MTIFLITQKLLVHYSNYKGNKGNYRHYLKKRYPRIFKIIMTLKDSYSAEISRPISLSELLYIVSNKINPLNLKCKTCKNKPVSFKNISEGYKTYCSDKCAHKDPEFIKYRKTRMKEKYGVEYALQSKEIKEIVKEKNRKQFSKDGVGRKKYLKAMQEKYGVDNPMNIPEFRNKISETWSNIDNEKKSEITKQRKETKKALYGDENFNNSEKRKRTLKEKYGIEYSGMLNSSEEWLAIKDKRKFLIETLPSLHPLKIAKEYNVAYSTVYKLIREYELKHLIRHQFIGESEVVDFIKETIDTTVITNNRTILNGKELDIYIPEKNLAIEFNGLYWHSELNGKNKKYHLDKTIQCQSQDIQLLHIFEDEWTFKESIVKSIIKAKLGIFEKRIYARKCEIKEIDNDIKNTFLESNHIQGKDNSKVKIGLFYNNELVEVMTFGHSRYNKKYQYEMHRFASKQGYQIIGGASKLWKYFLRNYNPNSVITFADRRYSNGLTYEKIGFKKLRESSPNFFIINDGIRESRLNWQKHKQEEKLEKFNPNLTAWENMQVNGYDRIWDCGNYVFGWQKD